MSTVRAPARPYAAPSKPSRYVYADTLKVLLVAERDRRARHDGLRGERRLGAGDEPPVREPLETLLNLAALVGVLFAMSLFFLVAGAVHPAFAGPQRSAPVPDRPDSALGRAR